MVKIVTTGGDSIEQGIIRAEGPVEGIDILARPNAQDTPTWSCCYSNAIRYTQSAQRSGVRVEGDDILWRSKTRLTPSCHSNNQE
jgi:hypothetical protein